MMVLTQELTHEDRKKLITYIVIGYLSSEMIAEARLVKVASKQPSFIAKLWGCGL